MNRSHCSVSVQRWSTVINLKIKTETLNFIWYGNSAFYFTTNAFPKTMEKIQFVFWYCCSFQFGIFFFAMRDKFMRFPLSMHFPPNKYDGSNHFLSHTNSLSWILIVRISFSVGKYSCELHTYMGINNKLSRLFRATQQQKNGSVRLLCVCVCVWWKIKTSIEQNTGRHTH